LNMVLCVESGDMCVWDSAAAAELLVKKNGCLCAGLCSTMAPNGAD
jgi:hypothetical protein